MARLGLRLSSRVTGRRLSPPPPCRRSARRVPKSLCPCLANRTRPLATSPSSERTRNTSLQLDPRPLPASRPDHSWVRRRSNLAASSKPSSEVTFARSAKPFPLPIFSPTHSMMLYFAYPVVEKSLPKFPLLTPPFSMRNHYVSPASLGGGPPPPRSHCTSLCKHQYTRFSRMAWITARLA